MATLWSPTDCEIRNKVNTSSMRRLEGYYVMVSCLSFFLTIFLSYLLSNLPLQLVHLVFPLKKHFLLSPQLEIDILSNFQTDYKAVKISQLLQKMHFKLQTQKLQKPIKTNNKIGRTDTRTHNVPYDTTGTEQCVSFTINDLHLTQPFRPFQLSFLTVFCPTPIYNENEKNKQHEKQKNNFCRSKQYHGCFYQKQGH